MAGHAVLLSLSEHEIFKVFKDSLPEEKNKTQNLIDCKEDILYLWHGAESCLLTLNLKTLEAEKHLKYQKLVGTEVLSTGINTILVNTISTWVVLGGPHDVCVMRLPRRSGPLALFQGGRDTVICKSLTLDQRYYMSECEVYKMRWLPNSTTDSHLLVLTSDNTLRLYDVASDDQPLKQVWQIGRRSGRLPLLAGLGDLAVDVYPGTDDRAVVLTGNGNVHYMEIEMENSKALIEGPLTMYPPADDNYGLESCSILRIGDNFITIATCGGTLYHCVLIPDEQDSSNKFFKPNNVKQHTNSLYVIEALELDLGLSLDDDDTGYTCPIYLIPDEGVKNRYFCFHETGVHIITVPLITHLEKFYNSNDENLESKLPSLNIPSTVEYAICTKTSKIDSINPPLGICITYSTHALIALLSDGRLVIKLLDSEGPANMLFNDSIESIVEEMKYVSHKNNLSTSLNEMQKVPFHEHIRSILKHELSQPILKMFTPAEPSPQGCFELLSHATHAFREDYFSKLEFARKEIEKRMKTLRLLKKLQLQELEEWQANCDLVLSETDKLNEKCESAKKTQQGLNKRCEKVLRCLREKQSAPTIAEKNMATDLESYSKKVLKFNTELQKITKKQNIQKTQMENWDAHKKKEEVFLGKHLTEIIKTTLEQQTKQIKDMVEKINTMKIDVDIK